MRGKSSTCRTRSIENHAVYDRLFNIDPERLVGQVKKFEMRGRRPPIGMEQLVRQVRDLPRIGEAKPLRQHVQ